MTLSRYARAVTYGLDLLIYLQHFPGRQAAGRISQVLLSHHEIRQAAIRAGGSVCPLCISSSQQSH